MPFSSEPIELYLEKMTIEEYVAQALKETQSPSRLPVVLVSVGILLMLFFVWLLLM
tara:strand:- start:352 stop:519 length:168 start_codon:yes stop_codon:yes gene_type:complete